MKARGLITNRSKKKEERYQTLQIVMVGDQRKRKRRRELLFRFRNASLTLLSEHNTGGAERQTIGAQK